MQQIEKKQKIAYFIDSMDPGGAETLVLELCKRMHQHEFTPEIFHFGNAWLQRWCGKFSISCIELPRHKSYRNTATLPIFAGKFSRFLRQRGVHVLHSHLFGSIAAACMATRMANVLHVGTMHDIYTIREKPSRYMLLQLASLLGTRLITVSEQMQTYFNSLGKLHKPHFTTIYNGVDIEKFSAPTLDDVRATLQIRSNDIVLISVGRLVEVKRYDVLIKAFADISSSKHVRLLIVGDGPCRQNLEELVADLQIEKQVDFLGFRDNVPELLQTSDCFVLSSDSEGLSYSIAEAMAAGLPSVVTDVGGNRELVENGNTGYVVPADDPCRLANSLHSLIEDARKRKMFGQAARVRATRRFSIEATVDNYVQVYRELLS